MVKKLSIFLSVLVGSSAVFTPLEAGKKYEHEDQTKSTSCKLKVKSLSKNTRNFSNKKRTSPRLNRNKSICAVRFNDNPYTVENLHKAGFTKGLPKPKF